jgi:hypothetical protein
MRDARILNQAKLLCAKRPDEFRSSKSRTETDAPRGKQPGGKMQGWGLGRHAQPEATVDVPVERKPEQRLFAIAINLIDESQRFATGADQDMQPIVELDAVVLDTARTAAQMRGSFVYRDGDTAVSERYCGRHARVTTSEHSNVHASQVYATGA